MQTIKYKGSIDLVRVLLEPSQASRTVTVTSPIQKLDSKIIYWKATTDTVVVDSSLISIELLNGTVKIPIEMKHSVVLTNCSKSSCRSRCRLSAREASRRAAPKRAAPPAPPAPATPPRVRRRSAARNAYGLRTYLSSYNHIIILDSPLLLTRSRSLL